MPKRALLSNALLKFSSKVNLVLSRKNSCSCIFAFRQISSSLQNNYYSFLNLPDHSPSGEYTVIRQTMTKFVIRNS